MNIPRSQAISSPGIDVRSRDIRATQPANRSEPQPAGTTVPELAPITDLEHIGPAIQSILATRGLAATAEPVLEHVRHRTHKPHKQHRDWMSASWRCPVEGSDAIVVLRARRDGGSRAEYDQWCQERGDCGGIAHLPRLDATAWVFPHDPALPRLAELTDPDGMIGLLERLAVDFGGIDSSELATEIVHYYPEQRCTLRIDWTARSDGRTRAVYVKAFRTVAEANRLDANCRAFRAARRAPAFAAPVPLGADPRLAAVAFAEVPHCELAPQLATAAATGLIEDCGRRLAGLHGTDMATDRTISVDHQHREIEDKLDKLALAMPPLRGVTDRLRRVLRDDRPTATPVAVVTHGDFHLRQVGVAGPDDLVLFDFDEMCTADPARDIASFLISLQTDPTTADITGLTRPFLDGYADIAPVPASLAWQLRVQLATKAYRAFRAHRADARSRAVALLERAAEPDLPDRYDLTDPTEGRSR